MTLKGLTDHYTAQSHQNTAEKVSTLLLGVLYHFVL